MQYLKGIVTPQSRVSVSPGVTVASDASKGREASVGEELLCPFRATYYYYYFLIIIFFSPYLLWPLISRTHLTKLSATRPRPSAQDSRESSWISSVQLSLMLCASNIYTNLVWIDGLTLLISSRTHLLGLHELKWCHTCWPHKERSRSSRKHTGNYVFYFSFILHSTVLWVAVEL